MSDATLGKKPKIRAQRDAVHVAVLPVQPEYSMAAGTRVIILDRHANPITVAEAIGTECDGVLDPFLAGDTNENDLVWMLVNPDRMIAGVRHDWELSQSLAEDIEPSDGDKFCCAGVKY
jgi:hypothetical protein